MDFLLPIFILQNSHLQLAVPHRREDEPVGAIKADRAMPRSPQVRALKSASVACSSEITFAISGVISSTGWEAALKRGSPSFRIVRTWFMVLSLPIWLSLCLRYVSLTGKTFLLAAYRDDPLRGDCKMSNQTAGERPAEQLDEFDRRILAIYQYDTRVTGERIGQAVGLSAAAVQRRLKRLRARSVIIQEEARLDAKALGLPTTCIVGVDLEYERNQHVDEFKQRMREHPNVRSFTTMVAMDAVKSGYALPLSD